MKGRLTYIRFFLDRLTPERTFLVLAFIFGSLFLFITPPFQVPDEPNHFLKAWQIADGHFKSVKQDQRLGGSLPAALDNYIMPYFKVSWNKTHTIKFVADDNLEQLHITSEKRFYDFANTAMYSFVCYAPQALGIFIGRIFTSNVQCIFYTGRIFGFLTWLTIVFFAIRLIPFSKWLFCYLALLPMSLYLNMSYSADLMTNALCFLFLAYVLRLSLQRHLIANQQFVFLVLLVILLTAVKIVYVPLLFLLFLLPKNKFREPRQYYLYMTGLFFISLVFMAFWSFLISDLYIPYDAYNTIYRDASGVSASANVYNQLFYLKADYTRVFSVLGNSFRDCSILHIRSYIGTFGWLDTEIPEILCYVLFAMILVIAGTEHTANIYIKWPWRLMFVVLFFLILSLVFLSQYLNWVGVGAHSVWHIQGRYLIPFYPLLFMVFYGLFPSGKNVAAWIIVFLVPCLAYVCLVLFNRFIEPVF